MSQHHRVDLQPCGADVGILQVHYVNTRGAEALAM